MHEHKTTISHSCRQRLLKFSQEKVTEKKGRYIEREMKRESVDIKKTEKSVSSEFVRLTCVVSVETDAI